MSNIGLFTFLYILVTFLAIQLLPNGSRLFFSIFTFAYLITLVKQNVYESFKKFKPNRYFFLNSFVFLIFVSFVTYHMMQRWMIEPYGMWDAWAIWNLKAKTLTNEFLYSNLVHIPHKDWAQKDYPLGLPILNASIGIAIGHWTQKISYFIQFCLHSFIGFSILKFFYQNKKHIFYGSLALSMLAVNSYYLMIASDLCAELILATCLILIYIEYFRFNALSTPSSLDFFLFGITISLPMLFKNEGLLISLLFYFLILIRVLIQRQFSFRFFLFMTIPIIVVLSLVFYWKLLDSEIIPVDYQNRSYESFIREIRIRGSFIWQYFLEYHKSYTFYLFPVSILLTIIAPKKGTLLLVFHLSLIILLYNITFLFSNREISWHLSTAYVRIHSALIPVAIFIFCASIRNLVEKLYEKF